uniref:Glycosyltransferase n=1 Tax=Fallopia multiflora TaxID=76025 RepID=A0A9E8A996_9CARY|nr:UDP-glycosyltransferase [Fallopia multiflora]
MTISKTANLVLIPAPGMGHLAPAIELAKHLVARDPRLSITVLLIKGFVPEETVESYILSLKSNSSLLNQGIGFIDIPQIDLNSARPSFLTHMNAYQPKVKEAIEGLRSAGPLPVAGLLVDMFCTSTIDVATELGLPSYVFFTSGAGLLRLFFHLHGLGVDVAQEYDVVRSPDTLLEIPGFRNPVPVKVLPGRFLSKDGQSSTFLRLADKFRQAKGILVNTCMEIDRDLIQSMSQQDIEIPPIYPVGPILNLPTEDDHGHDDDESSGKDPITRWLDDQPPRSVVFLCFGSRGTFNDTQIKEIAVGLERSGQRFLWSLRQRPGETGVPLELDDPSKVLPEGFFERTAEKGRVIGWAPQARVLAHKAVGAFVSHCGWNSTLESFWYGVPIAAWPIYAEQQLNAFVLVKELGLATEIRIDYCQDFGINMVVKAEEVEDGINKAMKETEVKKKVKEMCDKARKALEEGGSSYESIGRFIEVVFKNLP